MRVIGYLFSKGEFNGFTYDNVIIQAVGPISKNGSGEYVKKFTVKRSSLPVQLNDLLGSTIVDVNYDENKKVKSIIFEN